MNSSNMSPISRKCAACDAAILDAIEEDGPMNHARAGSVIAGTWLIGLGVVFIAARAMNLSWAQAWPLFVILVGLASLVSTALNRRQGVAGLWTFTWPVAWIVVGVLLLMSTTGRLGEGPLELIGEWWPIVFVVVGVWFLFGAVVAGGRGPSETLVLPVGDASEADVRIRYGAGTLTTGPAAPGNLVDGEFAGGVRHRLGGNGKVELDQDMSWGMPWLTRRSSWNVGLTTQLPLAVRLDTGASRSVLDFRDHRLRSLELHTGASETRLLLPREAGATTVRAEAGAASLTLEVPNGVAARIRTRMALGSSDVDQARFPRRGDVYESPDYASASNRVEIDIEGGVGSFRVVGGA
jgi:hypothetical protein